MSPTMFEGATPTNGSRRAVQTIAHPPPLDDQGDSQGTGNEGKASNWKINATNSTEKGWEPAPPPELNWHS